MSKPARGTKDEVGIGIVAVGLVCSMTYLAVAFCEWNLNPGEWRWYSRVACVLLPLITFYIITALIVDDE